MQEQIIQLKNLLRDKKNILLLTHHKIDGDGLASMLIVSRLLKNQGKQVTAFSGDEIPSIYHFLPGISSITPDLRQSNELIISLTGQNLEIDKLKYSLEDNRLNIIVTPKNTDFLPENLSMQKGRGDYDLIMVFDSGDLEHLGKFYEDYTDLFYSTPIVNIDHHITNTAFGHLNIVDTVAASTTQIVAQLLPAFSDDFKWDEDLATLVLTGLIVDTGSFQHTNTSPQALEMAADLIEKGARQQEIIQNIYKTKKLSTLKLWGRVLAKIEEDPIHRLVWSSITKEDLQETGATPEEAEGLIDELMTNAPGAEIVALIKNSLDGLMSVSLRSTSIAIDTLPIANRFGGGGHKQASGFKQKGSNFNLFVAEVIDFMEKYQAERLNLKPEDIQALQSKYEIVPELSLAQNKEEVIHQKIDIISELKIDKTAKSNEESAQPVLRQSRQERSEEREEPRVPRENPVQIERAPAEKSDFKSPASPNMDNRNAERKPYRPDLKTEGPVNKANPKNLGEMKNPKKNPDPNWQKPKNKVNPVNNYRANSEPRVNPNPPAVNSNSPRTLENSNKPNNSEKPTWLNNNPASSSAPAVGTDSSLKSENKVNPANTNSSPVNHLENTSKPNNPNSEVPTWLNPNSEDRNNSAVVSNPEPQANPMVTKPSVNPEPRESNPNSSPALAPEPKQSTSVNNVQGPAPSEPKPVQNPVSNPSPTPGPTNAEKAQAIQYAQHLAQQLQGMNPQTPEYAQIYQWYQYYSYIAQQ